MGNNGHSEEQSCMICKAENKPKTEAVSFGYSEWAEMHLFVCRKHVYLLDTVLNGEGSGTKGRV